MKRMLLALCGIIVLALGCKKDNSANNTNTNPTPTTPAVDSPYYIQFTYNDTPYSFRNNLGGTQLATPGYGIAAFGTKYQSLAPRLFIHIRFEAQPPQADLIALAGRTLRTGYSGLRAQFVFSAGYNQSEWNSSADSTDFLKIDSIAYTPNAPAFDSVMELYTVVGSFQTKIYWQAEGRWAFLGNGKFKLPFSRSKP